MVGTSGSSPTDSPVGAPTKMPRLGSPAWPFRGIVTTPKDAFRGSPRRAAELQVSTWPRTLPSLLIRRAQRARCQAETPPIILSRCPAPALTSRYGNRKRKLEATLFDGTARKSYRRAAPNASDRFAYVGDYVGDYDVRVLLFRNLGNLVSPCDRDGTPRRPMMDRRAGEAPDLPMAWRLEIGGLLLFW
jgi:hypothetical protein